MTMLRRHRHSQHPLLVASAVAALLLWAGLFVAAELRDDRVERRYAKLAVGDVRILEDRVPVGEVRSSAPAVAVAEYTADAGLVVRALRGGHAELSFVRADGRRLLYDIAVQDPRLRKRPIQVVRLPPRPRPPVAGRRPPRPETDQQQRRREELARRKKPEPLREVKPKGQVVSIEPPANQERPRDARYLSEYDSHVKEETRARSQGPERGRPGPRGGRVPPAPRPPGAPKADAPTAPPARPKGGTRPTPPRPTSAPALAMAPDGRLLAPATPPSAPTVPQVASQGPASPEPGQVPGMEPGDSPQTPSLPPGQRLDLAPSPEVLRQALGTGGQGGASAFPDKLDVKEGDRTFLNTKEWKGASFFNRMKSAVARKWNPAEVYSRRDPSGNLYGVKDRYTLVHVTLNGDGSLRNLRVLSPSGVDFLDEEAMGALEAAQPFPNPPPEVKDKDGLIRFRFGFSFEISDRPTFKVFR